MKNAIKAIYTKLPIIRELQSIDHNLNSIEIAQQQHLTSILNQHVQQLLMQERYCNSKRLNQYEMQVFSQSGEDGIISEIFRRIGVQSQTFVEIGVGNGLTNNTVFLLFQNWSGYWIESSQRLIDGIHHHFRRPISEGRLKVIRSFVTAENINNILHQLQIPNELDLFSIDIDRNTYWIWAALPRLRPRVIVVEYNATLPSSIDWKVEYVAERSWNGTNYFGASLKAYELLGRQQGYNLVGCSLSGVNAFFVRQDLCEDMFEEPYTSEHHYEPARYYIIHREGHPPCFSDDINSR